MVPLGNKTNKNTSPRATQTNKVATTTTVTILLIIIWETKHTKRPEATQTNKAATTTTVTISSSLFIYIYLGIYLFMYLLLLRVRIIIGIIIIMYYYSELGSTPQLLFSRFLLCVRPGSTPQPLLLQMFRVCLAREYSPAMCIWLVGLCARPGSTPQPAE